MIVGLLQARHLLLLARFQKIKPLFKNFLRFVTDGLLSSGKTSNSVVEKERYIFNVIYLSRCHYEKL